MGITGALPLIRLVNLGEIAIAGTTAVSFELNAAIILLMMVVGDARGDRTLGHYLLLG
jgi:hypothetical protein